jgi:hypothetical protein
LRPADREALEEQASALMSALQASDAVPRG